MNADWDDAPIRVRKHNHHAGMVVSVVLTLGIFGGAAYLADSKGWISLQHEKPVQVEQQPQAIELTPPKPIPKDDYDEQVNRLLRESAEVKSGTAPPAEMEQQETSASVGLSERGDDGLSRQDASIAILNAVPWGSGAQSQPRQQTPRGSYVTIVEETKRSCWGALEGSTSCRRIKQLVQQADRRHCEIGGNQAACDRANRY